MILRVPGTDSEADSRAGCQGPPAVRADFGDAHAGCKLVHWCFRSDRHWCWWSGVAVSALGCRWLSVFGASVDDRFGEEGFRIRVSEQSLVCHWWLSVDNSVHCAQHGAVLRRPPWHPVSAAAARPGVCGRHSAEGASELQLQRAPLSCSCGGHC